MALRGCACDRGGAAQVWDWKKGELLAKAPGLVCRPLGVHQLAVAPTPLAVDAQGRRTLLFTLVGVANAPKFGTLAPAAGTGPTRWVLTWEVGKLGLKTPPPSLSCVAYGGEAQTRPWTLVPGHLVPLNSEREQEVAVEECAPAAPASKKRARAQRIHPYRMPSV